LGAAVYVLNASRAIRATAIVGFGIGFEIKRSFPSFLIEMTSAGK